jgi:GNAT superfamily N-acetyltransferase
MDRYGAILARIRFRLREVGFTYTLYLVMQHLSSRHFFQFQRMFIIALPIDAAAPDVPPHPCIREATRDETSRIAAIGGPVEDVEEHFDRGDRCWVFERDGKLLACDWIRHSAQDRIGWIILGKNPDEIWSAGILVDRTQRGQGVAPQLRAQVIRECARGGVRRMLGFIDTPNRNSVRALDRVGYRPIGILFYLKIFGFGVIRSGKRWHWGLWSERSPLRLSMCYIADSSCLHLWNAITD